MPVRLHATKFAAMADPFNEALHATAAVAIAIALYCTVAIAKEVLHAAVDLCRVTFPIIAVVVCVFFCMPIYYQYKLRAQYLSTMSDWIEKNANHRRGIEKRLVKAREEIKTGFIECENEKQTLIDEHRSQKEKLQQRHQEETYNVEASVVSQLLKTSKDVPLEETLSLALQIGETLPQRRQRLELKHRQEEDEEDKRLEMKLRTVREKQDS